VTCQSSDPHGFADVAYEEPMPPTPPPVSSRDFDAAELRLDAIVHVAGVGFALAGAATLLAWAFRLSWGEYAAAWIYASALVVVLAVSATYNMWPVSRVKWILRRFDHSAIYLLIAGTYTPFLTRINGEIASPGLLAGIWAIAGLGITLKLTLPGRFDRLSILLYLGLGWSGLVFYEAVFAELPASTMWWLAAGGLLYTIGVIFHVWERLRFQNAIWHAFVLFAAACHYGAVMDYMVLARI
jgi:hemolysin III